MDYDAELGKMPPPGELPPMLLCRCSLLRPTIPCKECLEPAVSYLYAADIAQAGAHKPVARQAAANRTPALLSVLAFLFALWMATIIDSAPSPRDDTTQRLD